MNRRAAAATATAVASAAMLSTGLVGPAPASAATLTCSWRAHSKTTALASTVLWQTTEAETRLDVSRNTDGTQSCFVEVDGTHVNTHECYTNGALNFTLLTSCTGPLPPSNYKSNQRALAQVDGGYESESSPTCPCDLQYYQLHSGVWIYPNGSASYVAYADHAPNSQVDAVHYNYGGGGL